jgi:hypothetical protein
MLLSLQAWVMNNPIKEICCSRPKALNPQVVGASNENPLGKKVKQITKRE